MNSWPVWSRLSEILQRSFLIALSIACLLGQSCAAWGWSVFSPVWAAGSVFLIFATWFCCGHRLAGLLACLLITFCLSNLTLQRVLAPSFPRHHLRHLALTQTVWVEGWLYREPERLSHRTRLYLQVNQYWPHGIDENAVPATGKVLVTVRHVTQAWQYGDVIRLPLRLRTPHNFQTSGSFDYEGYLARRGIYVTAFLWEDKKIEKIETDSPPASLLYGWIEDTRRTIGVFFSTHLDSQTSAILRALIIGDVGGVTKDVRETFARAGVAHVLAISGLHIGLVAVATYGAWWWLLGRSQTLLLIYTMPKVAALLTMPPVLVYASLAGLTGGRVATWRAVIMVLVYLASMLLGRQQEVYRSLALSALLISILWPGAVLEVSFQLSFVSMLVIFLGMARFSIWWEKLSDRRLFQLRPWPGRILRWGAAYLALSAFAIIGTTPITAAHFNQVAVAGLFANLIIVPLLGSVVVILGLVSALLSFLHQGGAIPIVVCAGYVIQAATWIVKWISAWPYAAFHIVTPTLFELILLYGLLACAFWRFSPSTLIPQPTPNPHPPIPIRGIALTLLFLLLADGASWTWRRFFTQDLRISFLDVGQGDAAVVEFPGSPVMVIDGGGFASRTFDSGEAIIAPFLWGRKIGHIDVLVMSHPQLDHYGGLAFLAEHFSIDEFWFNGEEADSERFAQLKQVLEKKRVVTRTLCRGTPDMNLSGVDIQVLHPPCRGIGLDTNNASLVLRLSHGDIDVLFSGDIEAEGENLVLATGKALQSEILKVPHHGSRSSSTAAFVQAVSPQLAIASLGLNNRFGFPASEVVERYLSRKTQLLRTDQVGTVTAVSDGKHYEIANPLLARID